MSLPLPKSHWLYQHQGAADFEGPPMPFRMGTTDPRRKVWADAIRKAGQYAVRAATRSGQEEDWDPDALVQCLVVGLLGYFTPDGLSSDAWANPAVIPSIFDGNLKGD